MTRYDGRRRLICLVTAAAALLAAPARPAFPADLPSPPGLDGFSERVLKGVRLRVGPRAAATAPDGTLHVVYGDSLLRHAWNTGSGWQTETLDATHGRGLGAALAFDAAGDLHVAYGDPLRGELFHGKKSATLWTSRVVARGLVTKDAEPAIAVSANGVVHIAWLDDHETTVRYAEDAGGSFASATLATNSGYGSDVDIALAPDGTPHAVFMSLTPLGSGHSRRALVHMAPETFGWSREELESGSDSYPGGVGAAASCVFTPDGVLHVFYTGTIDASGTPRQLRHARKGATGWETESIGEVGNDVLHTHAASDGGGRLHVAVGALGINAIARFAVGAWADWTVASPVGVLPTAAFALHGEDVHFAHAEGSSIVVRRWDRTTQPTEKSTIDRVSEPLQTPSAVADQAGLPRIAIVRDDAAGAQIEVLRRSGVNWTSSVVATGVAANVRPSLRVAPDGSSSVAYATDDGRIVCASDADGSWTAEDAVSGIVRPVKVLAHAIAPDGTRRLVWIDQDGRSLRFAREEASGWTPSEVASLAWGPPTFDVEVSDDGVAHVVWQGDARIEHATDTGGSWTTEVVGQADYGWGRPPALDLVSGREGALWIAFTIPWQFYDYADAYTNRDGAWTLVPLGDGYVSALGFLADGSARAVGSSGVVLRWREAAPQWRQEILDAGPNVARQFAIAKSSLTEGDVPSPVGVSTVVSPYASRVWKFAGAVDGAGACHAAFVDAATGDLRYATDRDLERSPATGSVEVVRGPGSVGSEDAAFAPGVLRFGDDDSGTKFVMVTVAQDGHDELKEILVLDLANPAGAGIGSASRHTVDIVDDDPAGPPPPSGNEHFDYFLPTKARVTANGSVTAQGVLHLGDLTLVPHAPLLVVWGDRRLTVPSLLPGRDGRLAWIDGDAAFSLRREDGSAARYRFDLRLPPGDAGGTNQVVASLELDGAEPSSFVTLARGRLDIARGVGMFGAPPLHVGALHGVAGEHGSVVLTVYTQGLDASMDSAPRVGISVGELFVREIAPESFRARGGKWIGGSRTERVIVDHALGVVTARFEDVSVGTPAEGVSTLDVRARVLAGARDVTRSLRTRITSEGGRFRN